LARGTNRGGNIKLGKKRGKRGGGNVYGVYHPLGGGRGLCRSKSFPKTGFFRDSLKKVKDEGQVRKERRVSKKAHTEKGAVDSNELKEGEEEKSREKGRKRVHT